jgi:hypothetical protein
MPRKGLNYFPSNIYKKIFERIFIHYILKAMWGLYKGGNGGREGVSFKHIQKFLAFLARSQGCLLVQIELAISLFLSTYIQFIWLHIFGPYLNHF